MNIDALQTTTDIVTAIRGILSAFRQHEQDLAFYDNEYLDLTHALEFAEFGGMEAVETAIQLQQNRINRREAKRQLEQLGEAYEYLSKNPTVLNTFERMPSKIKKIQATQKSRIYTPRTNSVLKTAFDKASIIQSNLNGA